MARVIPQQWVDMKTGRLTMEALRYLNDLETSDTDGVTTIGIRLSGVSAKTDAIIAGTQPLSDVVVSGRGSIVGQVDVINDNVASVAASVGGGGALAASVSPSFASGQGTGGGPFTSGTVTVTASGGTAPYAYAWTKKSGDTLTVNSPTANATTFTGTPGVDDALVAVYTCTVTDDVSATVTVDVSVTITDITSLS